MQVDIETLFNILRTEPEIEVYINPFISAYINNSMEQLQGQLDGAKISVARLSSPSLYYVLSGNDFTLDINNPSAPKIVSWPTIHKSRKCMGRCFPYHYPNDQDHQ